MRSAQTTNNVFIRHGITLPPYIAGDQRGEIRVKIDQLVWHTQPPKRRVSVFSQWWGEKTPGVEFNVSSNPDSPMATTAVFPVTTNSAGLFSYLKDMGNGLELLVVDTETAQTLGSAALDLSALRVDDPIDGLFEVTAQQQGTTGGEEVIAQLRVLVLLTHMKDKRKLRAGSASPNSVEGTTTPKLVDFHSKINELMKKGQDLQRDMDGGGEVTTSEAEDDIPLGRRFVAPPAFACNPKLPSRLNPPPVRMQEEGNGYDSGLTASSSCEDDYALLTDYQKSTTVSHMQYQRQGLQVAQQSHLLSQQQLLHQQQQQVQVLVNSQPSQAAGGNTNNHKGSPTSDTNCTRSTTTTTSTTTNTSVSSVEPLPAPKQPLVSHALPQQQHQHHQHHHQELSSPPGLILNKKLFINIISSQNLLPNNSSPENRCIYFVFKFTKSVSTKFPGNVTKSQLVTVPPPPDEKVNLCKDFYLPMYAVNSHVVIEVWQCGGYIKENFLGIVIIPFASPGSKNHVTDYVVRNPVSNQSHGILRLHTLLVAPHEPYQPPTPLTKQPTTDAPLVTYQHGLSPMLHDTDSPTMSSTGTTTPSSGPYNSGPPHHPPRLHHPVHAVVGTSSYLHTTQPDQPDSSIQQGTLAMPGGYSDEQATTAPRMSQAHNLSQTIQQMAHLVQTTTTTPESAEGPNRSASTSTHSTSSMYGTSRQEGIITAASHSTMGFGQSGAGPSSSTASPTCSPAESSTPANIPSLSYNTQPPCAVPSNELPKLLNLPNLPNLRQHLPVTEPTPESSTTGSCHIGTPTTTSSTDQHSIADDTQHPPPPYSSSPQYAPGPVYQLPHPSSEDVPVVPVQRLPSHHFAQSATPTEQLPTSRTTSMGSTPEPSSSAASTLSSVGGSPNAAIVAVTPTPDSTNQQTIHAAALVPHNMQMVGSSVVRPVFDSKTKPDGSRALVVNIHKALHITMVSNQSDFGNAYPPSCFVTYELHGRELDPNTKQPLGNAIKVVSDSYKALTHVVHKSCSPVWNCTQRITVDPNYQVEGMVFNLWHNPNITCQTEDTTPVDISSVLPAQLLGSAHAELTGLKLGMGNVEGWYHIYSSHEGNHQSAPTIGQLYVGVAINKPSGPPSIFLRGSSSAANPSNIHSSQRATTSPSRTSSRPAITCSSTTETKHVWKIPLSASTSGTGSSALVPYQQGRGSGTTPTTTASFADIVAETAKNLPCLTPPKAVSPQSIQNQSRNLPRHMVSMMNEEGGSSSSRGHSPATERSSGTYVSHTFTAAQLAPNGQDTPRSFHHAMSPPVLRSDTGETVGSGQVGDDNDTSMAGYKTKLLSQMKELDSLTNDWMHRMTDNTTTTVTTTHAPQPQGRRQETTHTHTHRHATRSPKKRHSHTRSHNHSRSNTRLDSDEDSTTQPAQPAHPRSRSAGWHHPRERHTSVPADQYEERRAYTPNPTVYHLTRSTSHSSSLHSSHRRAPGGEHDFSYSYEDSAEGSVEEGRTFGVGGYSGIGTKLVRQPEKSSSVRCQPMPPLPTRGSWMPSTTTVTTPTTVTQDEQYFRMYQHPVNTMTPASRELNVNTTKAGWVSNSSSSGTSTDPHSVQRHPPPPTTTRFIDEGDNVASMPVSNFVNNDDGYTIRLHTKIPVHSLTHTNTTPTTTATSSTVQVHSGMPMPDRLQARRKVGITEQVQQEVRSHQAPLRDTDESFVSSPPPLPHIGTTEERIRRHRRDDEQYYSEGETVTPQVGQVQRWPNSLSPSTVVATHPSIHPPLTTTTTVNSSTDCDSEPTTTDQQRDIPYSTKRSSEYSRTTSNERISPNPVSSSTLPQPEC